MDKKYRDMTPEEQKQYRHERYRTANFEITLKLKDLNKEQYDAFIAVVSTFKAEK